MLTAITHASLLDDVFREDPTTTALESRVAALAGKPAALLMPSGTMANIVALRTLLAAPPYAVLVDARAHVVRHEAGGVAALTGALVTPVVPRNGVFLTLEDVVANASVAAGPWDIHGESDGGGGGGGGGGDARHGYPGSSTHLPYEQDVHECPTRVIALENTLGGTILPLAEATRISAWARTRGIALHLDGARLWEVAAAAAAGDGDGDCQQALAAHCALFDSVSLCFSKGLGAPIGSVVVGSAELVARARWVRKSVGGGLRQAGVVAAAARVAVEETFLGGRLRRGHEGARRLGRVWEGLGGRVTLPVQTNMVWLDLEGGGGVEEFVRAATARGLKVGGERIVVHYQICEQALEAMEDAMREVRSGRRADRDPTMDNSD